MAPINQPGRGDVHVDGPLTTIAIAFAQNPEAFIADRVFPILSVAKQTDKYFTIPRGAWFRDEMKKRAPGALSAQRTHEVSTDSYACDVWALHEMLADQVRANYDSPLQADREMTEGLSQAGMIRKELQWVTDFFGSGLWTTDQTGVDSASPSTNQVGRWDRADSTPIEDVRAGKRRVQARTGFRPNKLVVGREVYDALLDHPDIVGRLDRGQTQGAAIVMRQNLAALFELEEVLVMDSVVNSATEGATDSIDFIGGKSALLVYAAPSPGLYVPSAGYTFSWTGLLGAGALGMRVKRIRDEKRESDMIEIQMAFDQKLVSADLGQFFITIVN
jgi:hypothetical protein